MAALPAAASHARGADLVATRKIRAAKKKAEHKARP